MNIILLIIISYLIGCFSSAYLIGKIFRKMDIRCYGSGNAGATNAMRVMGKKLGVLTFLLDFSKGIIAVLIGYRMMGYNGGLVAAVFAVIGHDWPIFLGFKGGKGVATTIGCFAVLNFPLALISVIIGITVGLTSKFVSLGSIVFLSTVPILKVLFFSSNLNNGFLITSIILAIIGIYKHRSNIKRLLEGNENRIGR